MTTIKHIFSAIVFCLLTVLLPAHALGQTVRGRVVDGQNNPLFGVTVTSEKGANSITTDFSGAFTLDVNDGSTRVVFALTGFFNRVEPIGDGPVNVTMALSSFGSDDVVNAGYTSYRKVETTGAISTVYGGELEKSPTITIQETLAGRLPGLTNNETGSDPQSAITQLFARGHTTIRANQTVFIIDGVVFDYAYDELLDMMTSAEIESVSVIKDGASQALYGIQGGDGVIVITTKKGKKGPLRINVKADATIQQVTTTPTRFSSAAYAHMRNQAAYNDNHEVGKNFY